MPTVIVSTRRLAPAAHAARLALAIVMLLVPCRPGGSLAAQRPPGATPVPAPTGREIAGVPALNYDADEGFGYGAILELYDYGAGVRPYRYTVQPTLFLTTAGRRDFTVFVDAPAVLPGGWRVSAFAGREEQLATPYYGVGNAAPYDARLEVANPHWYRFGRDRLRATLDLQHRLGGSSARVLLGAGAARVRIDRTPFDEGATLVGTSIGGPASPVGWDDYVRAGLVWDTRDREVGPHSGTWSDLLVQRVSTALGATRDYTRWTATVRQYVPLASRLTLAERVLAQNVTGDAPFYELATVQTSFKQQDGLGGSSTIRGVPKDRYVGKGLALSNTELRWRARDFTAPGGKPSFLLVSGFVDAGRVWSDGIDVGTAFKDLHVGYGGGLRLGYGESFVVALDVGHSKESTAPVYIGLGYVF